MKKLIITIEITGGSHEVKVTDSAGNEKICNSLVLSAGNTLDRQLYMFAWGHPRDAAWALGEGMAESQGKEWWDSFILCHTRDMAVRALPIGDKTTAEEVLDRWEKENAEKRRNAN